MTDWFARPVLHVTDVEASLRFYVNRLGFTSPWRYDEEGRGHVAQVVRHQLQLDRRLPCTLTAFAVGGPDAVPAWPIRREVEAQLIGRQRWVLVEAIGVDDRSQVHRVGPPRKPRPGDIRMQRSENYAVAELGRCPRGVAAAARSRECDKQQGGS